MQSFRLLALGVALLLAGCGVGTAAPTAPDEVSAGPLRLSNIWLRTPNDTSSTDALYMVIRNTGSRPDSLLGATSDAAATVELHQTSSTGGVVAMRPIPEISIPAGGAVAIESGAYHLMLLDRTRVVKAGDLVTVTLLFQQAGTVVVQAEVRDAVPTTERSDSKDSNHQH
ncbi:MAG: copper chaperone PCu(A)C [Roseiflexaceae bacterium]|nr:copper chaperone PCu(A)C [Roseiflexaceae bacterium]